MLCLPPAISYATLGEGKKGSTKKASNFLSARKNFVPGFSLKSGYKFKGNQIFSNPEKKYIQLNTTINYPKGNNTIVIPLKKKIVIDNIQIRVSTIK
ncbi:MAG: hypothetical protein N2747_00680 [Chitinophagaceae bacterium]|nr:hypothetical protein [Chitinophagaceae bacterium]